MKSLASLGEFAKLRHVAKSPPVKWTREHLLIALNLYGKVPFGQFHYNNPLIMDVASRMGRSSGSLAMKLSNLASLDPVQKARGIRGLPGASEQDRRMWKEFHANLDVLGPESEQLLHDLFTNDNEREVDFLEQDKVRLERSLKPPAGATDATAVIRVRRGQQFFRQTILSSYGVRCCISEISVPRLLVASHIKPWRDFPKERLNPQNGVCLSSLHDAAFDAGLITIDETFTVLISPRLKRYLPSAGLEHNFTRFEGARIRLPEKVAEPNPAFLRYHHNNIFQK